MTCKNCIHFEVCDSGRHIGEYIDNDSVYTDGVEKECATFKDAARIFVLPRKVGDTVYMPWIFDGVKGIAHLTVTSIVFESGGMIVKTDLDSDAVDYLEKYKFGKLEEDDFGKTVFLTREEAEAALKQLQEDKR